MEWFDGGATALPEDPLEEARLRAAVRRPRGLTAGYAAGGGACRGMVGALLCLVVWGVLLGLDGLDGESASLGAVVAGVLLLGYFGGMIALPIGAVVGAVLGLLFLPASRALRPGLAAALSAAVAAPVGPLSLLALGFRIGDLDQGGWVVFLGVPACCAALGAAWHVWRMARLHVAGGAAHS